ncbi:MAG: ABC transporter ATP-binding protein [Planctomycetota bacterium]|nr:MAG: ABC transporter ATP-binding protein [Planctomycetota bacterium]
MKVDVSRKRPDPSPASQTESVPGPTAQGAAPPPLEARNLGRRFGRRWVVRDLSFQVPRGSVTALLGRNGVGKSTTIQLLLGLLDPSEGEARAFGADPRRLRADLFRRTGYVSERRELLEDQSVEGLARIVAELHGPRFDRERFEDLRRRYELDPQARCKTLSKGQRARLLLALALAPSPELLVLDEPTSGLDVLVRDDFLAGIAEAAAEEDRAVLLSSHLIDDVARICDRAVILREGRPPLCGDLEALRASCSRYLVRLKGVLPASASLPLPADAVLLERDPRALTLVAQGACEHLEAELDACLPVAELERRPATLKEAFACLSAPAQGGAS